jgi:hypothetical protein
MNLGKQCDEIIALIDETLSEVTEMTSTAIPLPNARVGTRAGGRTGERDLPATYLVGA